MILRTGAFNGLDVNSGTARCAVTNGSTNFGVASATLYSVVGIIRASFSSVTVEPHHTSLTGSVDLSLHDVAYCECAVPSATTWRCTLVYATSGGDNGASVTTP
jgi:hypothetical protein